MIDQSIQPGYDISWSAVIEVSAFSSLVVIIIMGSGINMVRAPNRKKKFFF
jgi:hypothetical protein